MRISDTFQSKYVASHDLRGREITVTISHVTTEELQDGQRTEYKPVVFFQGAQKGMVLNKTNAMTIASAFGDETDHWSGKQIVLFTVKTQNPQGQLVDGLRCRAVLVDVQAPVGDAFGQQPDINAPPSNPLGTSPASVLPPLEKRPEETPSQAIDDDIPF